MKLHIISDIHLEFADMPIPEVDADVTIVAGDLHNRMRGLNWIKKLRRPTIYVLGNHEFYGYSVDNVRSEYKKQKKAVYLEKSWVEIGDVKIFGCTLWTDFKLFGDEFFACHNAKRFLNDFQFIKDVRMKTMHKESLQSINKFLKESGKKVIVTHHAPSLQSVHPRYRKDALTPAFASNLDELVYNSGASLWIHGHMHDSCDYMIGDTRVICNPRGYPPYNSNFNPNLVAEV